MGRELKSALNQFMMIFRIQKFDFWQLKNNKALNYFVIICQFQAIFDSACTEQVVLPSAFTQSRWIFNESIVYNKEIINILAVLLSTIYVFCIVEL